MGSVNYAYINHYFINEIVQKKNYTLQNAKTALDMQIKQMNNIAFQYTTNKDFYSYYLESIPASFYGIQSELKNQKFINSFTQDMLFYNSRTDRLYSFDSVYTLEYYDRNVCDYSDYTAQSLRDFLKNSRLSGWLPLCKINTVSGHNEILTYVTPVEWNSLAVASVAVFQIEKQTIDKLVAGKIPGDNTITLLYYGDTLIYSSSNIPDYIIERQTDLMKNPDTGFSLQRLGTKEYFLNCTTSQDSGIKYICLIPHTQVKDEVRDLMFLLAAALLSIILVGAAIIIVLMRMNYSPLKRLGSFAKNVLGGIPSNLNDIEAAQYAITNLSESNKAILSSNRLILQERLLLKILRGGFKDLETLNSEGKEIGVHLWGPSFIVATLSLERWDESGLTYLIRQLEDVTAPALDVYAVEYLEQNSIILIISGEEDDLLIIPDKLHFLGLHFMKSLQIICTIGIGNPVYTAAGITESYRQACIAARCKEENSSKYVVQYSDLLINERDEYSYPTEELNTLYNAILSGNTAKIEFVLATLTQVMQTTASIFLGICLCYDIINMAIKAMNDLNRSSSVFMEKYRKLAFKSGIHSTSELTGLIKQMTYEIINTINSGGSTSVIKDIEIITEYVKKNFTNSSFSVKTTADHFKMSVSNLSHYFKSRTGQNVSDYINKLRFEEAKRLLITTELPISEIVSRIGYFQSSSFIKKFRKLENMTPGEYRFKFK